MHPTKNMDHNNAPLGPTAFMFLFDAYGMYFCFTINIEWSLLARKIELQSIQDCNLMISYSHETSQTYK